MAYRSVRTARRLIAHVVTAALACSAALASPVSAQLVPLRTVPVASGDQFLMLPSATLAMGGLRLAVDDSLADGWTNPAKGALVPETAFLGSPTFYAISNDGGAGRTFPVAAVFAGATVFGGGALALQQIENNAPDDVFIGGPVIDLWTPPQVLSESFSRNLYASAFVGLRVGSSWSVGLGGSTSALDAMDGVDLLYAGSERIEQSGGTRDVRLGLYRAGDRDRLALLLLHSRVSMEHDVTYAEWIPDDGVCCVPGRRLERNEDRTRTWGAHLEWDRALSVPGWRIGASGTVNRKSHPKIPNYDIQSIPRDPGATWAYEAAVGFARNAGPTTFGLEVALQPIWSETWQEADTADVTASGGSLQVGDRSIDNDFFFTNVMLRSGLSHDTGRATLQAGLEVRSYAYTLEQVDNVQGSYREQDESWMEWTPTFGVALRFATLDVRYTGRVTTGTGRPGTQAQGGIVPLRGTINQSAGGADFILAPSGPLTLRDADVFTHQLSVRVPVR